MNELTVFENEKFGTVRTTEINGRPYFMASDVAKALGYARPNDAVNQHCRATVKYSTPISGKMQEVNFIPEGDIYRLVIKSQLPEAEKFESWIFDDVLPTIRKHGAYMTPETLEEAILNPDMMIRLCTALKDEQDRNKALLIANEEMESLKLANTVQQQQIAELTPKASYYDLVLQCPDLVSVTEIAKDYGKSAKWLNKILAEHKIQYKLRGIWILHQKYAKCGYTSTKTNPYSDSDGTVHTKPHTYWTQKGRLFLYEFLKSLGYLPVVEQQIEAEVEKKG